MTKSSDSQFVHHCRVTACDRNGHVLDAREVEAQTTTQLNEGKEKAFHDLKASYPDAQIYYNTKSRN